MKTSRNKKILKLAENSRKYVVEKAKNELEVFDSSVRSNASIFIQATELGFSIALPPVLGALFGLWIDRKLLTQPFCTLLFLSIGTIMAFARVIIIVKHYSKNNKKSS